jgi:predicted HTH transcriptional regulator
MWRLKKKVEREHLVLAELPALSLQILEFAREHGRVTMGEILALTGANRNTVKGHLHKLVEGNYLEAAGKGRGAWYRIR